MSAYFPSLGSAEYTRFCQEHASKVQQWEQFQEQQLAIAEDTISVWAKQLLELETIESHSEHLGSYLGCLSAADGLDEKIKQESALHSSRVASVNKLLVAARAALGQANECDYDILLDLPELAGCTHYCNRLRHQAKRSMSAPLEQLSEDLAVNGIAAWGRLYDQVSGTLDFSHEVPGQEVKNLPVSMTRNLLEDKDPAVRHAAFSGSAKAWESVSDVLAASLNAIAGTRLSLYKARGIPHYLDPALHDAGISRKTLEAMLAAVRAKQSMPQAYLKRKAKLLGLQRLGFADLMAPLSDGNDERISWDRGVEQIQNAFSQSYPALAQLAEKAVTEKWIDHKPRPGKRPGGFCSSSHLTGQSRIFMTYNGAQGDVQTLAHELGHSFHSYLMRDMRPWASQYPMTLAETASTFAENLVTHQTLQSSATSEATKTRILDQRLQDSAAFMLNIPMRFDFESSFYEARAEGELSVGDFKGLMLDAQRKNYGDSLDAGKLDPWFWASKLHFYITEISFYNFPYTFGYLFSMGLFARFIKEGSSFLPRYEKLLMQTGSAPAEKVASDALGVDLESIEFWEESIEFIAGDWNEFEKRTA